jgi:hypothetical protein
VFLKWCSRSNKYGTSLVTGLLKHISAVTHKVQNQEILESGISFAVFPRLLNLSFVPPSSFQEFRTKKRVKIQDFKSRSLSQFKTQDLVVAKEFEFKFQCAFNYRAC